MVLETGNAHRATTDPVAVHQPRTAAGLERCKRRQSTEERDRRGQTAFPFRGRRAEVHPRCRGTRYRRCAGPAITQDVGGDAVRPVLGLDDATVEHTIDGIADSMLVDVVERDDLGPAQIDDLVLVGRRIRGQIERQRALLNQSRRGEQFEAPVVDPANVDELVGGKPAGRRHRTTEDGILRLPVVVGEVETETIVQQARLEAKFQLGAALGPSSGFPTAPGVTVEDPSPREVGL